MMRVSLLIQFILVGLIKLYQFLFSPLLPKNCCFYPSCSDYFAQALQKYGLRYGFWLGIKRLFRCHPWSLGGYDPVPFTDKLKVEVNQRDLSHKLKECTNE